MYEYICVYIYVTHKDLLAEVAEFVNEDLSWRDNVLHCCIHAVFRTHKDLLVEVNEDLSWRDNVAALLHSRYMCDT